MRKKRPESTLSKGELEEARTSLTGQRIVSTKTSTVIYDKKQYTLRIPIRFAQAIKLKGGEKFLFTYHPDKKPRRITAELVTD